MDEEEKLRILVIIEKLLENSIGRSTRLERVKSELEKGLQNITDEDKNFVLEKWKKYNEIDSIIKPKPIYIKPKPIYKKPKPFYKNPMFLILSSILGLTVLIGISVAIESENSQPENPFKEWSNAKEMVIGKDKIDPDLFLTEKENTANTFSDTKNSFLEKFGKLENNGELVLLEYSFEETKDNKLWKTYDVIRLQSETKYGDYSDPECNELEKELVKELEKSIEEEGSVLNAILLSDYSDKSKSFHEKCPKENIREDKTHTNVGVLTIGTKDRYIENITFKITHNFDIDVMGIADLLYKKIGKEYVYAWSDGACLDSRYDDKCFYDNYNNMHLHFLNGGPEGLEMRERSEIISDVYVSVKRDFKKSFSVDFISN